MLFPTGIDTSGIAESSEGTMCAGFGCSTLSKTIMVPNPTRTPGRYTKKTFHHGGHADTKERSDKACQSRVSKSGSMMENFKSASSKRKFSSKAQVYIKQARRTSTQRMYQARLAIYRS